MPTIPTAAGAKKAVTGSGAGVGAGAAAGAGAGAAGGAVGASSGACCGASATAGGGGAGGAWQEGDMLEENRLVLFHGNKAGSFLAFGGVDPLDFHGFVSWQLEVVEKVAI